MPITAIRRQPHFAPYVLPPESDNLPKLALTFYVEQMYKLATVKTLPKYPRGARGSTGRAIGIFSFFDAMASTEEKRILRERDAGKDERLRIGTRLNDLVVRRLAGFFREENMEIPNVLQTQSSGRYKTMGSNFIEDRLKQLPSDAAQKRGKKRRTADRAEFGSWRARVEAAEVPAPG